MCELFNKLFEINSIYFWLIVMISIFLLSNLNINTNKENLKMKISIFYIILYLLRLFNMCDIKILILIFICISFVFLEFIFTDSFTKKVIIKWYYYVLDYLYKLVFEYKALYFFVSLLLISNFFRNSVYNLLKRFQLLNSLLIFIKNNIEIFNILIIIISALTLARGIIKSLNNRFEVLSFEEIYEKIKKVKSNYNFKVDANMKDYSNILIEREDRSYFERKNSYNWIGKEFFIYKIKKAYKKSYEFGFCQIKYIGRFIQKIWFLVYSIFNMLKLIYNMIKRLMKIIFNVTFKGKSIKGFSRGYSTIEMQLIRTIAVKNGYNSCYIQRKFYEIIYSSIFFDSLKQYWNYNISVNNSKLEFKYYLLYLYLYFAPVKVNGIMYDNIYQLTSKKDIKEITKEEFYVWALGISYTPVNDKNLNEYYAEIFDMDREKLLKTINKLTKS